MGNQGCCGEDRTVRHSVTFLQNQVPKSKTYLQFKSKTIRFGQIAFRKSQRNIYVFTMQMKQQNQIIIQIPVLSELVDCITCQNYQLSLHRRMVIDIFNKQYTSTLMEAQNQKTNRQFSIKIYPFRGFNTYQFKKGLYEIWINRKIQKKASDSRWKVLQLVDCFLFGVNKERQSLVLLFEKATTSLANIAQYRLKANWHWTKEQKITIISQILQSYSLLNKLNIIHRNIRPSNIFYNENIQKFVLGNFSTARLYQNLQDKEDLITVCGVPFFAQEKVKNYIDLGQSIGRYNGRAADYVGIRSIVSTLESCHIFDKSPHYQHQQLAVIYDLLINNKPINQIQQQIRQYLNNLSINSKPHSNDDQIAKSANFLLAHTHKVLIEQFLFQTYYNLGYNKQFSEIAHQKIQKNNDDQQQLENAFILKRLAEFYDTVGEQKGPQYYQNSLNLFLQRVQRMIKYGHLEKAQIQLQEAKGTFLKLSNKFQTKIAKIQLDRVRSLVLLQKNDINESIKLIQKTIAQAAKEQINLESQLKLIITLVKVLRNSDRRSQALQRLNYGLGICGNTSEFKSPSSCRIHKSNFYFQLGIFYVDQINSKYNPQKSKDQQSYKPQLRAMAEANFKAALEIRQRQNIDDVEVTDCLSELGSLFYMHGDFYQAKRTYQRGLVRINNHSDEFSSVKIAQMTYSYGSCCYYLGQYQEAKRCFENAVSMLQKFPNQYLLKYNIQGNIGLCMIQIGRKAEGKQLLFEALDKIKKSKENGQNSYDYACLLKNYYKISKPSN